MFEDFPWWKRRPKNYNFQTITILSNKISYLVCNFTFCRRSFCIYLRQVAAALGDWHFKCRAEKVAAKVWTYEVQLSLQTLWCQISVCYNFMMVYYAKMGVFVNNYCRKVKVKPENGTKGRKTGPLPWGETELNKRRNSRKILHFYGLYCGTRLFSVNWLNDNEEYFLLEFFRIRVSSFISWFWCAPKFCFPFGYISTSIFEFFLSKSKKTAGSSGRVFIIPFSTVVFFISSLPQGQLSF